MCASYLCHDEFMSNLKSNACGDRCRAVYGLYLWLNWLELKKNNNNFLANMSHRQRVALLERASHSVLCDMWFIWLWWRLHEQFNRETEMWIWLQFASVGFTTLNNVKLCIASVANINMKNMAKGGHEVVWIGIVRILRQSMGLVQPYQLCKIGHRLHQQDESSPRWSEGRVWGFNQVDLDQSQEWLNGIGKKGDGIAKMTSTLSRWALSFNLRAHLANETKLLYGIGRDDLFIHNKGRNLTWRMKTISWKH